MDLEGYVASLSDEQLPEVLDNVFRRRAGIEYAIEALLREIERRRIYRHQPGHHNGALRGRAVRRVGATSHDPGSGRGQRA